MQVGVAQAFESARAHSGVRVALAAAALAAAGLLVYFGWRRLGGPQLLGGGLARRCTPFLGLRRVFQGLRRVLNAGRSFKPFPAKRLCGARALSGSACSQPHCLHSIDKAPEYRSFKKKLSGCSMKQRKRDGVTTLYS